MLRPEECIPGMPVETVMTPSRSGIVMTKAFKYPRDESIMTVSIMSETGSLIRHANLKCFRVHRKGDK